MYYIKINSNPKVVSAHSMGCPTLNNTLPVQRGILELCYAAEGSIPVTYGDTFYLQKKYHLTCNPRSVVTSVNANRFHIHNSVVVEMDYELLDAPEDGALAIPEMIPFSEYGKPHAVIDEIIRTFTLAPQNTLATCGMFLHLLSLCDTNNSLSEASHFARAENKYATRAKEFVYANLSRPITQTEIAESLGITPEYLCAVFKQVEGEPLMTYVNRVKLAGIRGVMKKEGIKLYEAAELYGYRDPNYVSRLFKKFYGETISQNIYKS